MPYSKPVLLSNKQKTKEEESLQNPSPAEPRGVKGATAPTLPTEALFSDKVRISAPERFCLAPSTPVVFLSASPNGASPG